MENKCLYCYLKLENAEKDFHVSCSKKIFGTNIPPILDYSENQIEELASSVLHSHSVVTGVQPKLSLGIKENNKGENSRFTIVGIFGNYILKPPNTIYQNLPEIEDLTMRLAEIAKIQTVQHSLIRLKNGSLAYITKRIDRDHGLKLHMEDMCQLTQRMTEHKYKGSYEQIAKIILKYSANPFLDVVNFYEQVFFSFLTGNADMHLKNFSLIHRANIGYTLSPAYDLVASQLINLEDKEDLALTINGRKTKIKRQDFLDAFSKSEIDCKIANLLFSKFQKAFSAWAELIDRSFIPEALKGEYKKMLKEKMRQIDLVN